VPGAPTIHGTLALKPATGSAGLGAQNGNGSLSVASGGVLSSSGAAGSALALVDIPVTNAAGGTVTIGAPSTVFRYGAQVSNSGTVSVTQGGHLDMSSTTLTNTATGTVGVTVNATNATTSGISGAVTAAGTLAVQTIGSPAVGSTFVPITGPVSGTFAAFAFGPHAYTVTYPSGSVQLTTANSTAALTVWRPSTGRWYVRGQASAVWGQSGDKPVPGDYTGDGRTDLAVWRPSTGRWYVHGQASAVWGQSGDKPAQGDYTGDGRTDLAVWRPSTGRWYVRGQASVVWGRSGDKPVPGDYTGDGRNDLTTWRPSTGAWYVRGQATVVWGQSGDMPVGPFVR
jgi:ribosomal protein L24E